MTELKVKGDKLLRDGQVVMTGVPVGTKAIGLRGRTQNPRAYWFLPTGQFLSTNLEGQDPKFVLLGPAPK